MSKLAKFFIICAAVCVLGIVMTFAGYAAGGVDKLDQVAEKHDWLNIGPNATETDLLPVGEFKSIETEGSLDIAVIAPGFNTDEAEALPELVEEMYSDEVSGSVAIKWGNHTGMPEVTNDNGVLKIKGNTEELGDGVVNLSGDDPSPDVVVFCSEDELDSISVNGKYGDTVIAGVKCKVINITADSGDIEIEKAISSEVTADTKTGDVYAGDIVSSKLAMKAGTGDIDITGCVGEITAETTTGDIEFATSLPQNQFETDLSVSTGEISINEEAIERQEYFSKGEPNKLVFRTDTGDIDADFAED